MIDVFHFNDPFWFLTLIPLAALLWSITLGSVSSKSWEKVIDAKLLPLLLQGEDKQANALVKWLVGVSWLIAVIALADPVWEKIPRPIFQTNNARVIVLDLSNSMLADDLKPSRLARARFKIEDILSKDEEGQIGLVVFAGSAFTAAPLTRDSDTIRSLLQVLTPEIMPSQGSRVDLGLIKAQELLAQAGVSRGQVLLIADGISDSVLALEASKSLDLKGHSVSVLGVGTEKGAELRFARGKRVTVKLEEDALREIARSGSGRYHKISGNNADLNTVISKIENSEIDEQIKNDDLKSNEWKSTGPYLILLLLPLAAFAFRKGWLLSLFMTITILGGLQPQPALASPLSDVWHNLWKNNEQQADFAFQNQHYDKASQLTSDSQRLGSAEYKKGNYQEALDSFNKGKGANARYNEGNTLAKLEKYKEAIAAYEKALKQQPDLEDAKLNKKAIEDYLKQQQKQEQQKNDSKDNKKDKDSKNDSKSDEENKSQDGQPKKDDKNKKGKEGDKANKDSKNQFADANKDLKDKEAKKKEGEEEAKEKEDSDKSEKNKPSDKMAEQQDSSKADDAEKGKSAEADKLTKEEKMAAEQWLRRIPDDPGRLLRNKFLRQYRQRTSPSSNNESPW